MGLRSIINLKKSLSGFFCNSDFRYLDNLTSTMIIQAPAAGGFHDWIFQSPVITGLSRGTTPYEIC